MSAFITRRGGASSGSSVDVVTGTFEVTNVTGSVTIADLIGKSRFVIDGAHKGSGSAKAIFIRYIDGDILEYRKSGYNMSTVNYSAGSDESAAYFDPATGTLKTLASWISTEYDGSYHYTVFG